MQEQQYILEVIEKLVLCCENLLGRSAGEILKVFEETAFVDLLDKIHKFYESGKLSGEYKTAMAEILSVKASAVRVADFAAREEEKAAKKLEFELLPLLENLRLQFFYTQCLEDEEARKKFWEKDYRRFYKNRYVEKAEKTGKYKYDLSIIVVGYNKLEYTKMCVESLKRYLPEGISCELIFLNHGSSDGTKEYFESQKLDKQVDIEVNRGCGMVSSFIVEGKYTLAISNDVLVTKNAIENMYTCITSDEKIGWVVPTTPNVSNLQTIESDYTTIQEMYEFAEKNNISNPKRWEEKLRLCNPLTMMKSTINYEVASKLSSSVESIAFPDDKRSLELRRAGYKLILAKDAYCYHFGSVTIENQVGSVLRMEIRYCKGRIDFLKEYGIDPWGYGMAYDVYLMQELERKNVFALNILGINSGLGGNPLKLKDICGKRQETKVTYLTQYGMYWEDVKALGDKAYRVKEWTEADKVLTGQYDYILLENGIGLSNVKKIVELTKLLTKQGRLLVRVEEEKLAGAVAEICKVKEIIKGISGYWLYI